MCHYGTGSSNFNSRWSVGAGCRPSFPRLRSRRHGLDSDGRLGAATIKQMNVPLRDRVLQLQFTLERWRWLPSEFSAPPIIVNIPDFRLRALDENNNVVMDMRVVVGKAMRTQ